jgi:hypothetical protein
MPEAESQMKEVKNQSIDHALRSFSNWAVVLSMTLVGLIALILVVGALVRTPALLADLLTNHLRAVVGVPLSGASAFCVLLLLEARAGNIKFSGWGLNFEGASGPAVIWIFAFMAFGAVIRMLW